MTAIERLAAPATHAEIAEQEGVSAMDPVTLYRTLETLLGAGFVHLIRGVDGANRYCPQPRDQKGCPGNHPHFVCERCGTMRCLVDQVLPKVKVPAGALVVTRHFVASGICQSCSESSS
ncbi:MAG: transcriptional repressor [Proteobacteria bacterium]|nr:transcriptional repressor [Pseudomonadota bacterium]